MRRMPVEDTGAAAIEAIAAAVPKGFHVEARSTDKPGQIRAVIFGPRTEGHRDGEVVVGLDISRRGADNDYLDGIRRSCQAWAQEPLTAEGEALEQVKESTIEKPARSARATKGKDEKPRDASS